MKKVSEYFNKLYFPDWSIPLALMAICGLAFGLLIPKLGFYQDDWHFVYYAYTHGAAGLSDLLNFDGHPLAAPLYIMSFNLLGFNPVNWQIYSLFWRWLAVATFWLVLHRTWPEHRITTFAAAAIYIIYPLYTMQPMAIVYFEVWISHFLLAASFLLTIEAIKQPKRFWFFTIIAILFKILHTFSSEYTWGIEFARPILIWLALPVVQNESFRRRLFKTIQIYAPYLIIFLAALIWRGFLYHSPVLTRSDPHMLDAILANPLGGIKQLLLNSIPDMVLILVSTWFRIIAPDMFSFSERFNTQVVGLMIFSAVGLGIYFRGLKNAKIENNGRDTTHWLRDAAIFGTTILIFGMLPVYAAGYFAYLKVEPWNGRFVIGSMPGVALLTSLFIEKLLDAPRKRVWAMILIISLGIGWQMRTVNDFRWAWDAETNFYRQMILRAPELSPHTAIIAQEEFLGLMGDYPTSFALNTLYATPGNQTSRDAKTWLFVVASNFGGKLDAFLGDKLLQATKHSTSFSGKNTDSLVIRYEPDLGQCLWIITPENAKMPIVPITLQDASVLTNTSLIKADATPPPFLQIIMTKQPDDWCAYYQRGSLAHQEKDWNKATAEWQEATKKDLSPSNGFEYLPFIESYARLNDWQQALDLTRRANKLSKGMENILCSSWDRYQQQTDSSPVREKSLLIVKESLDCR